MSVRNKLKFYMQFTFSVFNQLDLINLKYAILKHTLHYGQGTLCNPFKVNRDLSLLSFYQSVYYEKFTKNIIKYVYINLSRE